MKAKWIKIVSVLCMCLTLALMVVQMTQQPTQKGLNDTYTLGDVITIPMRNLSYMGEDKIADFSIVKPSGTVLSEKTISLDEVGQYVVSYQTNIKGKKLLEKSTFVVQQKLYDVDKRNASATYGAHPYTPSIEGIMVALNSGAKFIYNDVLDLSNLTKNTPVLEIYLTPEKIGERDFEQLNVRFIDVYDENNYIDIAVNSSPEGIGHPVSYMRAGAAFQPLTGFEYGWNRLHRYNRYGYAFDMSFYGVPGGGRTLDQDGLVIAFDYAERQLHGKKGGVVETMVIDFDSRDHFDELWDGFTTGEVKMEISADFLRKANANFFIKNILGQDLSREFVEDTKGPDITIDYDGYTETQLPKALVNHPYPIYQAIARDAFSGVVDIEHKVYFDYLGAKEEFVVEDGAFVPSKVGDYQIAYTALDDAGNETTFLLAVEAINSYVAPILTIQANNRVTEGFVGEKIPIAQYSVQGGIGRVSSNVKVFKGTTEIVLENNQFIPLEAGEYRVVYEAIDYVLRMHNPEYIVYVEYGEDSFIYDDASLPWYFVDSKEYLLPELESIYYTNTGTRTEKASIVITDMIGTTELGNPYYVPRVANHGDLVTIKYVAGNTEKVYQVPVFKTISNQNYDLKRYFDVSTGVITRANQNSVNFQTSTNNSSATLITALSVYNVDIRLSIDESDNFIGGIDIILVDAANPDIELVTSITGNRSNPNLTKISADGSKNYNLQSGFNGDQITVSYDKSTNTIYSENRNVAIRLWDFEGFESDFVYIKIVFRNVVSKSVVHVHSISSQIFSSVTKDLITPLIILSQVETGQRKLNDLYTLKASQIVDVLDPEVTFHVTVRDPKGQVIKDINGINLNQVDPRQTYQFNLNQYGTYRITYYASDTSENVNQRNLFLIVPDDIKPTLSYQGLMPKNAKLGDLVVGSNATATDNIDEKLNVYMYLVTPSGNIVKLPGNAFYATEQGTYILRYMTFDSVGNTIIEDFEVLVS